MINTLLNNWHFMRWLRLGLGLFFVYQAITNSDNISGFFGAFLLFQAVTNTGCGPAGCSAPHSIQNDTKKMEPEFEIIKAK